MNNEEIEAVLSKLIQPTRAKFLGVFARDMIPAPNKIADFPACFVANSDPSDKPGEHWLAFYYPSPNSYEFFDSYGMLPSLYGFPSSILPSHISKSNSIQFQCLKSNVCGPYCIYFLYHRCLGIPMAKSFSHFSASNVNTNDFHVQQFVNQILPRRITFRFCKSNTPLTIGQHSVAFSDFIRIKK